MDDKESANKSNWLDNFQKGSIGFVAKHKKLLTWIFYVLATIAIACYLIAAVIHNAEGAIFFLVVTSVVILWKLYTIIKIRHGETISSTCWAPFYRFVVTTWPCAQWWVLGPFLPTWISNYAHHKVWDEITCLFPNFNGCIVEVWERPSNFIPHFTVYVITYPWWKMRLCTRIQT